MSERGGHQQVGVDVAAQSAGNRRHGRLRRSRGEAGHRRHSLHTAGVKRSRVSLRGLCGLELAMLTAALPRSAGLLSPQCLLLYEFQFRGTEFCSSKQSFIIEIWPIRWFTSTFTWALQHHSLLQPSVCEHGRDGCAHRRSDERARQAKHTLYFLGDFLHGEVEKVAAYRKRLNCKTIHFC